MTVMLGQILRKNKVKVTQTGGQNYDMIVWFNGNLDTFSFTLWILYYCCHLDYFLNMFISVVNV